METQTDGPPVMLDASTQCDIFTCDAYCQFPRDVCESALADHTYFNRRTPEPVLDNKQLDENQTVVEVHDVDSDVEEDGYDSQVDLFPELDDESEVDKVLREDLGGHNDDVMEVVVLQGRLESSQSQSEYEPSEDDSASQDEGCGSQSETGSKQRVLIVYEEKLRELMQFCPRCGALVESENTTEVKNEGSQLSLHLKCMNNCEYKWQSQPPLADIKGAGNLLFTAGIYFSGIPFAKFESFSKLINLKFFGKGTYFTLRQQYVFPVIKSTWKEQQTEVLADLKSRGGGGGG